MSHYAKVNNGIVVSVIVAEDDFFTNGKFVDTSPGQCIQTSFNTRGGIHYGQDGQPDGGVALRGNYAGVGFVYDLTNDVFYPTRPLDRNGISCASWIISSPNWTWTPPTQMPVPDIPFSKKYVWDEPTQSWMEINNG